MGTEMFNIRRGHPDDLVIALAGNPNTGKSTVFNALTGMNQYTGNWAGKTVGSAVGYFRHSTASFTLVDLPGTYSLLSQSPDEQVARDFLCWGQPDATIIVTDATCLERNLNLALQVLEVTPNAVVAVNLLDEAKRKGIAVDLNQLADELGVPVVGMAARRGIGLDELKDTVLRLATGHYQPDPQPLTYSPEVEAAVAALLPRVSPLIPNPRMARWVALRLLDGDPSVLDAMERYAPNQHAFGGETTWLPTKSHSAL